MELDRISKHVLVKLNQLDEATASELREALGLDQNQSIHYRMDEKLIPQNLVLEHPERREQPGSRKAARVYQITERGEDWADDHGHEITLSDLDEAEQEIQRLSAEIRDISSDVQSLHRWRQEQAGKAGGMSTRLTDIGDRVEKLEAQMSKHNQRDYSGIWTQLHDLDERTDRIDARLDELATADDIKQVKQTVDDLDERLNTLAENLDALQDSHSDWTNWGNQVDSRVQRLEQHASQGLLGRLKWLLFG